MVKQETAIGRFGFQVLLDELLVAEEFARVFIGLFGTEVFICIFGIYAFVAVF